VIAAGAAAGAAVALDPSALAARPHERTVTRIDFSGLRDGKGWDGWRTVDVANLRREDGEGLLEAGSDVFPIDPRPVAFAIDRRIRDGAIEATIPRPGSAPGVVLRRVGPGRYYAAIYDTQARALLLVRRTSKGTKELARTRVLVAPAPLSLRLEAHGNDPTRLVASVTGAGGVPARVEARDSAPRLQRAGDPGVLATAQTLLDELEESFPPFGNSRLGLYGTQEGAEFLASPAGQTYTRLVKERSTVAFAKIVVSSADGPQTTPASVVAATSGVPHREGARLNVATDLSAEVLIDVGSDRMLRHAETVRAGRTGDFNALIASVRELEPGRRAWWRARVRRKGIERRGPVRSFVVPPRRHDRRPVRIAVAACASTFGPIFGHLAERRPDVLVWQGDLNYPDTVGPLAQTVSGYAGIWRQFLRNPRLAPVLERSCFAPQRDDHDYGLQDARGADIPRRGIAPWDALMNDRLYYRFPAGLAEVWVLEQRRHKSSPDLPDTSDKTLLGRRQREWLLRTLASSNAPFKVICSPCSLFYADNARDGNWSTGFTAERELILRHLDKRVSGRAIFVTGDAHDTMVYDHDGVFEARGCPTDIPDPRDHPGVQAGMIGGEGVAYADTRGHFTLLDVRADGGRARLDVKLVREDGETPYARTFHARARM
jgi:hypothetical protein